MRRAVRWSRPARGARYKLRLRRRTAGRSRRGPRRRSGGESEQGLALPRHRRRGRLGRPRASMTCIRRATAQRACHLPPSGVLQARLRHSHAGGQRAGRHNGWRVSLSLSQGAHIGACRQGRFTRTGRSSPRRAVLPGAGVRRKGSALTRRAEQTVPAHGLHATLHGGGGEFEATAQGANCREKRLMTLPAASIPHRCSRDSFLPQFTCKESPPVSRDTRLQSQQHHHRAHADTTAERYPIVLSPGAGPGALCLIQVHSSEPRT